MGNRKPDLSIFLLIAFYLVGICFATPSNVASINDIDSTTCQCGVFLLGSPPLQFSADATPTLAGNPVAANCSSLPDRTRCANDCQKLVRAMSNQVNPLLVQTLVLSATKTLACQKFNASAKVPLPRIHIATPFGWRQEERHMRTTDPRWLAGFYRWCDSHWIYAGVSSAEPLCCANGLPVKCEDAARGDESSPNPNSNRNPRLIIKKRPEDDLSSEEAEQDNDISLPASSSSSTTTTTTESSININDTSMEKVEPFATPKPEPVESNLNSTVLAEAFQFVGALMRSLGMAEFVEGITTVLPTSTATELLKRVDVGGWVSKYQNHYLNYGREFNLGYCYVEYGLYNVANEGVTNIVSRVFGTGRTNRRVRRATIRRSKTRVSSNRPSARSVPVVTIHQSQTQELTNHSTIPESTSTGPVTQAIPTPITKPKKISNAASRRQSGNGNNQSQGMNLMNLLNVAMPLIAGAAGGNNEGDKVNALLQSIVPLVGQVATSPMMQGVVTNLVSNFLTPPDNNNNNRPPPLLQQQQPQKNQIVSGEESNEIEPLPRPPSLMNNNGRPPPPPQQDSLGGLLNMLGKMSQVFVQHLLTKGPSPSQGSSTSAPPKIQSKNPDKSPITSTTSSPIAEDRSDIVETISEVAKPFFISYFGVVPGIPGFGQLNIAERSGRLRDDTLTYDPDAGTGITDLIFGNSHLPSTGNSLFDFGNRIVYSFSRANDPTQGMYCMKQYSVNKLWDGFRLGVKTLFK